MYIYKEKNKFPHVVHIQVRRRSMETHEWLKNNIGVYKTDWFSPGWQHISYSHGLHGLSPYAFKTLEDAMAFKLRWS